MTVIRTPHPQIRQMKGMLLFIGVMVLLTLFLRVIGLITDWFWFQEVGYTQVFTVTLLAKIKTAALLSNPGCYPTCAVLSLAPLLALNLVDPGAIIIDAKSGVSGAGKKLEKEYLFSEIDGDFRAYKVNTHQHAPEIDQVLSRLSGKKVEVVFVPHLLPVERGILVTAYLKKAPGAKLRAKNTAELYKKFYNSEPFVRVREEGDFPRLKDVVKTNFCDIGVRDFNKGIIVIGVIDNLLKGASGQAVQNMNIMYKLPETTGLL